MNVKMIVLSLGLLTSISSFAGESSEKFLELPEELSVAIDYTATASDYDQDDFELALKKEEVLINLYSQSVRGKLPLNTFYQILIQWGAPKNFIKDLDGIYNKLEADEISVEEAEVALKDAVDRLNRAQKTGKKYADLLDRTTFFLAVLPVFFLIAD